MEKKTKKRLLPGGVYSTICLILADIVFVNAAGFLALYLRFEMNFNELIASDFLNSFSSVAITGTLAAIGSFWLFGLYSSVWRYAGMYELVRIIGACLVSTTFDFFYSKVAGLAFPRSYPFLRALLLIMLISCLRFSGRLSKNFFSYSKGGGKKRTLIFGAGRSADIVLREMKNNPHSQNQIVCIIDDDRRKLGRRLDGVKIVGTRDNILSVVEKYRIEEIIIAIPSATAQQRREIVNLCQKTNCELLMLPAIYQLASGEVSIEKIRRVDVLDLLGRDAIKTDLGEISGYISAKTVLVTGAGGSIGSELCRQISRLEPKKLVLLDIYENGVYSIQMELWRNCPQLDIEVLIGSVRDQKRIMDIFEKYRPDIVFHAAAHKHVPLMEGSPAEAVKNNIFGTYNVALAADRFEAQKMVLISTDKAVNPTNVMGASKRVCELIIEMFGKKSKTVYAAVRFGNVLGSNGSVIPLFRKQLENGGPITVTHKDITRYFMTIPEAVSLVLQAGAYAKDGEIFVLDMGEPVRIDDLARNMIRLSGLEPDIDIKIKYTGLRPGEKLYEELLLDTEGIEKTANDLIFIGHPTTVDEKYLLLNLAALKDAQSMTPQQLRAQLHSLVAEYQFESDEAQAVC